MRKTACFILLLCFSSIFAQAQEWKWKLGMDYFLDNMEYSASSYAVSHTLNGVWFNPMGGIAMDSVHTLFGGVNLLKIPGSAKTIDKTDITLFYQYETPKILFRAGSFQRREVLDNYSDFFFKDSVNNLMPLMRGVFWQIGKKDNFFNAWVDWTGYPSDTIRESFFVGLSGKFSKKWFFADFQSYMFHYANTTTVDSHGVSENLQLQASIGAKFSTDNHFEGSLSGGILAGYERDRKRDDEAYTPIGFVANLQAEYMGFGTNNRLYVGDARMKHYKTYSDGLYWGTPFLQGKSYFRSDWYARLIESKYASARLDLIFHYSENKLMTQQLFTVSVSFDNFTNRQTPRRNYPWLKLFQ